MKRITATEAARNFSRVIDRVKYERQAFLVERNGEPVVEIRPTGHQSTVGDLMDFVEQSKLPDDQLSPDVHDVIEASRRDFSRDPWDSD